MSDSDRRQRASALHKCIVDAGCSLDVDLLHDKRIYVSVPEYPDYGVGVDMTAEIDSYLATGTPTAADIVATAKQRAEDDNYYPAWNYILDR